LSLRRARLGRFLHPERQADAGDTRHVPHPFRDLASGLRPARLAALLGVGDAQQDDPFTLPHIDRHACVPHGGADVAVQDALELLPVPPLEHDLADLEQNARLVRTFRALRALRGFGGFRGGELWHPPSVPAEIADPEWDSNVCSWCQQEARTGCYPQCHRRSLPITWRHVRAKGRSAAWTEERGTSDEGRRRQ